MPQVERNIEIKSLQSRVFKILDDTLASPIWNLAVQQIEKIDEGQYAVQSTVGDFTTIRTETVMDKRISLKIEGGIFNGQRSSASLGASTRSRGMQMP